MNKWSLRFENKDLEDSFNNYHLKRTQRKVMFLKLVNCLLCFISFIVELLQLRYCVAGLFAVVSLYMLGLYLFLRKNIKYLRLLYPLLAAVAFALPHLTFNFIIQSTSTPDSEKLTAMLMCYIGVGYFQNVHQSYVIHALQHINSSTMSILSIYEVLGFNYLMIPLSLYSLMLLKFDYQNFHDQRQLFAQSQVNKSILDIANRVVSDKLVVYSYNEECIRFDCEMKNIALLNFINLEMNNVHVVDPFKSLLTDLYVYQNDKAITMSSFLYQLQCNKGNNHKQFKLDGFYKERHNKIKLEVMLQNIDKLKFIIKLVKLSKVKSDNRNSIQFIKTYEYLTTYLINKINKLTGTLLNPKLQLKQCRLLLHDYHLKMQIVSQEYSTTPCNNLTTWNVNLQIKQLLQNAQINYIMYDSASLIRSDYYKINLLFLITIRYLSKATKHMKSQVIITMSKELNQILIQFSRLTLQKQTHHDQLNKFINIIIKGIGNPESIRIDRNSIQFGIYSNLEFGWNNCDMN